MAILTRALELALSWLTGKEIPCRNAPPNVEERQTGKCHVCEADDLSIGFCPVCCHWMCRPCSTSIGDRAWAALLEQVQGAKPGCCGPVPGEIAA